MCEILCYAYYELVYCTLTTTTYQGTISLLIWQLKHVNGSVPKVSEPLSGQIKFWTQTSWLQSCCFYWWHSSTVLFCNSMRHSFPFVVKELAWKSIELPFRRYGLQVLKLPFRKCELQVLAQFSVLSHGRVIF